MKLVIPNFDQFKAFAKRHRNVEANPQKVDVAWFIATKFPFKVPFIIDTDRMGGSAKEQALILPPNDNVMTVIHEAWHYFMAPPEMLNYDNFGLGTPAGGQGLQDVYMRPSEADDEEEAVCYFTIATARKLRVPIPAIMDEMEYANLSDGFIHEKSDGRSNYLKILGLSARRDLSRFGFEIEYA